MDLIQSLFIKLGMWCSVLVNCMFSFFRTLNLESMQGLRFFSRLVGRSDPWSKKWWVIF